MYITDDVQCHGTISRSCIMILSLQYHSATINGSISYNNVASLVVLLPLSHSNSPVCSKLSKYNACFWLLDKGILMLWSLDCLNRLSGSRIRRPMKHQQFHQGWEPCRTPPSLCVCVLTLWRPIITDESLPQKCLKLQ